VQGTKLEILRKEKKKQLGKPHACKYAIEKTNQNDEIHSEEYQQSPDE